jgi:serine/threonine protein kinase/Flp pilus assembly protein TadD
MAAPESPVESIFFEALARASAEERADYVEEACGGDQELRRRVERLLQAHPKVGSFLQDDGSGLAATVNLPPMSETAGTVIGPYKLLQQIGEGGMGTVFMAEQTDPVRRKVALKVIKPGMDSRQIIARFEAERQALAMMDHVNIARVFDGGTTAGEPGGVSTGRPYFVMELVHGVPITKYCDDNCLTPRERLELFVPVCLAIQHAHQKGVIHRDIKPSNVMITLYDGKPVPKVIDFGVAKATEQKLTERTLFTQYGTMVGTFEYMSPEQAEMSALGVDTRSDIYSLGVLLYELLTGSTPLSQKRVREATYAEVLRMIKEEEPPRPSTRLSDSGTALESISAQRQMEPAKLTKVVRGELDWIVMKALEKDRNRRYETAKDLAADVQRYLHDEPVLACPPSAWYRLRKFTRRHKRALATATVLALAALLLVGVVAGSLGWMARDRSVRQAKLNLEIEHALADATKARDDALTLTDNPYRWAAALAEAVSDLKRAQGLAVQDETALEPATRERLEALQALLEADEADRRFVARFEQIRLEQAEVNVAISDFKTGIAFTALKEAFQRNYQIEFGATPSEEATAVVQQRPKAIQDVLLAALEICLDYAPKDDPQTWPWLAAVLDGADTGPWRKRAQHALQTSDWKALEQVVEEATTAWQPPSVLLRLALKASPGSPIRLKLLRRICRAYPGDFWSYDALACNLHYFHSQSEEAIRYYTAALALRPHNPAECVNLGNALSRTGDLDGAIAAYREALDGHPDYVKARLPLAEALERKGDLDGALAELREAARFANHASSHLLLGNVLFRSGRRDEAIASYRKAIALDPNSRTAHYNLGTALLEKKEGQEEAVASFQSVIAGARRDIELHPTDSDSHNTLAWILVTCPYAPLRDPVEGVKQARKAVELAPNDSLHWNTLGAAQFRAGNWKEAVAALEKSIQLRGGSSYDWFFLAMARWQLGDKETARQDFARAVQWMDKNMPTGKELGRFRAEAAELLGIEKKKE